MAIELTLYQRLVVSIAMAILDHATPCARCGSVHLTEAQEEKVLDGLALLEELNLPSEEIAPVWP